MNKILVIILTLFITLLDLSAQKRASMSQYMHNRYAINSAFAGNREALSLYAGYRKKWAGINGSPSTQYFSGHTPLTNEKIAVGINLFNSHVGVIGQTGAAFTYAYRLKLNKTTKLSLALTGGADFYSAKWSDVSTLDEFASDPEFLDNESSISPIVGFGSAWYSNQFFVGFSIPNMFHFDAYNYHESTFSLGKADYLLTGGYMLDLSKRMKFHPSALIKVNPSEQTTLEMNTTIIYKEQIWAGASYRTTKDAVVLFGYQINPQLRATYSFDYTFTDVSSYNAGTHEIALQFDFGYKLPTSNPKFF